MGAKRRGPAGDHDTPGSGSLKGSLLRILAGVIATLLFLGLFVLAFVYLG